MSKNLTEAETETPCPFIAFFCNGCEEEPCSCAEHGDMIDVCLPLSPDLPEEPTAGDLQSKKAQCCEWGDWGDGHEACEVYIRADRDKWRALAKELGKALDRCANADGFSSLGSAVRAADDTLRKLDEALKDEAVEVPDGE